MEDDGPAASNGEDLKCRDSERMAALSAEVGELRRRVADRTAQLDAFAYSISHGLRAPLRAISGFSAILLEEHAGQLDAEGKRLLAVVCENTGRMETLISLLLELSRVGNLELRPSRIDMKAMAWAMYCETAGPEEKAAFSFTLADLPEAEGDSTMLRLVWGNLLSNAIKYSSRSARREIRVEAEPCEGENRYRVTDSGAGFDMAHVGKLFSVFQSLHRAEDFEGTGVGLAIVKRIVERHGGKVGAEGRVGEGSTFWFSLPATAPKTEGRRP